MAKGTRYERKIYPSLECLVKVSNTVSNNAELRFEADTDSWRENKNAPFNHENKKMPNVLVYSS